MLSKRKQLEPAGSGESVGQKPIFIDVEKFWMALKQPNSAQKVVKVLFYDEYAVNKPYKL